MPKLLTTHFMASWLTPLQAGGALAALGPVQRGHLLALGSAGRKLLMALCAVSGEVFPKQDTGVWGQRHVGAGRHPETDQRSWGMKKEKPQQGTEGRPQGAAPGCSHSLCGHTRLPIVCSGPAPWLATSTAARPAALAVAPRGCTAGSSACGHGGERAV